jgi:hypothetical protein
MLIPTSYRLLAVGAGLAIVAGGSAALTWQVQDWRYGQQLQQQAQSHAETLNELTLASATMQRAEHDKRIAIEQRLATSDQTHFRAMTDAQRDQSRLRDRLATADVRLSVLLDATASTGNCAVPTATSTVGVVHGSVRAPLDPAHAQRIVGITDDGDRGLIALAACQAYVREVSQSRKEPTTGL